ncbi:MAG TPA: hypothetical protein VNN79_16910, partial [Actinomycetota bacterium]|nr:hypothetical protein [Actinomycetota bacterium]
MARTKRGGGTIEEGLDPAAPVGGFRDVEPTQDPIQRRRAAVIRDPIPIEPREVWLIGLIAAVCTALLWFRTDHLISGSPYFELPWDHHMYIYMAQHNPIDFHIAPYGWRILVPSIVWATHLSLPLGFQLVTLLSVWGTGLAVWALQRRLGFSRELAIAGMLLYFALGFATKWTLFDFWLTDPLAFLLATCAVLFALSGKDVGFAICLAVGVLAKESVIFVAPLAYTLRTRRVWDPALAAKTVAATVPAIVALVALHIGIPARNSDAAYLRSSNFHHPILDNIIGRYTYGAQFHAIVSERLHHLGSTLIRSVSAFGLVVPVLVGVGLRSRWARSFGLRALPFLVLVYAQLLFAYNTERLLVLGLIAVVPLATWGLEQLMEMRGVGPARYVALAAVVFGAQLIWKHEWEPELWVSVLIVAAGVAVAGPWRLHLPTRSPDEA